MNSNRLRLLGLRGVIAAIAMVMSQSALAFHKEEVGRLGDAVARMEEEIEKGNWLALQPPKRFYQVVADHTGMEIQDVQKGVADALKDFSKTYKVKSYKLHMVRMMRGASNAGAEYAVLPATTEVLRDGKSEIFESKIFAAKIDGGWHFFNLDGARNWYFFLSAFPEFEGVEANY